MPEQAFIAFVRCNVISDGCGGYPAFPFAVCAKRLAAQVSDALSLPSPRTIPDLNGLAVGHYAFPLDWSNVGFTAL